MKLRHVAYIAPYCVKFCAILSEIASCCAYCAILRTFLLLTGVHEVEGTGLSVDPTEGGASKESSLSTSMRVEPGAGITVGWGVAC